MRTDIDMTQQHSCVEQIMHSTICSIMWKNKNILRTCSITTRFTFDHTLICKCFIFVIHYTDEMVWFTPHHVYIYNISLIASPSHSLVPRPSSKESVEGGSGDETSLPTVHAVFDRLQYAKTKGEGLVHFIMWITSVKVDRGNKASITSHENETRLTNLWSIAAGVTLLAVFWITESGWGGVTIQIQRGGRGRRTKMLGSTF